MINMQNLVQKLYTAPAGNRMDKRRKDMAQYTQKAIIDTFRDMLKKMPFDKITVTAIVSACGISSNTFYYHYRDIHGRGLNVLYLSQRMIFFTGWCVWKREMPVFRRKCCELLQSITVMFSGLSKELKMRKLPGNAALCKPGSFGVCI